MVNFYYCFLPSAAALMRPLFRALAGKPKPSKFQWTDYMNSAFNATKEALAPARMLAFPQPEAELAPTCNASDFALGAVLEQRVLGIWQPLAFFSKQLRVAEQKYSAFDKELLALYLSTRHFRYYLKGRLFSAFTNHKPLTFAMANVSDPWSAWQQRHLAYISEFTTDVQHIASKDNPIADALSRTS
jgi:hypothetical protein